MKDKQWLLDEVNEAKKYYEERYEEKDLSSGQRLNLAGRIDGLSETIDIISQLEKTPVPVVPKFVADWFETRKRNLEYEIFNVISEISSKDISEHSKIEQWFDNTFWNGKNNHPIETVVRMQDGYAIEQEPLHYAKVKGWELIGDEYDFVFWTLDEDEKLYFSDAYQFNRLLGSDYRRGTKFTKKEWNEYGINDTNADFEKVED